MDLERQLEEQGYNKARADLESFIQMREILHGLLASSPPDRREEGEQLLAETDAQIAAAEKALAYEYAATVSRVDAENDADLAALQIEEIAELVAEELDRTNPDAAEKARSIIRGEPVE